VLVQIMKDKKYQQVADTAIRRYKSQDSIIKKRQEDEAKKREEELGGDEPEEQKQDEGAADADVAKQQDENSEEESERSEEEDEFATPDVLEMNFFTSYINLLFFTLALLCENEFKIALKITKQRDMMNLLATLMQVSEEKNQDGNLKRKLLKGASRLMASLSAAREDLGSVKLQLTQEAN